MRGALFLQLCLRLQVFQDWQQSKILKKEVMVLGPGVKTGLNIVTDNPGQLGADLVADAVAGLD